MNFLRQLFLRVCWHRFTWPRVDSRGHHYQICSICGTAYEYNWQTMKRTKHPLTQPHHA